MRFAFRLIAKIPKFLLLGLVGYSLTSCQGSNLGSALEGAIAPDNSTNPEAIAQKSNQPISTPTPITTPTISTTPTTAAEFPKRDRLADQMTAIAMQSLIAKTEKNTEKKLLSDFLYINFANSQAQPPEFSDIEQVPTALRPWIKDLNKLGTIAPKVGTQFQPNILVARREYARWLLQTNNRLYKSQPSRQIRLAQPNDTASFADIPNNHPDFAIVQGLANAGLIGGTGDRFRPNDPLLREELVQWKIPLDLRQPLPNATLESVSQVWGFKDGDRISETALSAIFADAQLRDLANIRRSFGFTTILQPQKPVTRAEAAASLWYFGTAVDGLSASKVLELDR
jgi:hypothetical protein